MNKVIVEYARAFFSILYPDICAGCGRKLLMQEEAVCMECLYNLPKTNFHPEKDNAVAQMFWGHVPVYHATAHYLFTQKGIMQKLIHSLKYKTDKLVGVTLGKQLAHGIKDTVLAKADVIVPVPLHPKKLRKRGYNQSEWIAKGVKQVLGIKIDIKNLYRTVNTISQIQRSRYDRWENVTNVFKMKHPKAFENKHILLIDDVVTTGATLAACATTLLTTKDCKVSIACLAKMD